MAINYNSNRVKHLKYNGSYVKELNYNGTITWEELYGTWVPGTLPTGLASISCSRTSSDPAISAGSITSGAELYNKDVLSFMLTPEAYWTANRISFTYTANVPVSGTETTLDVSTVLSLSSVTLSREMRTITVTVNTGIDSIAVGYTDSTGTITSQVFTSSGSVSAWNGGIVTWLAAVKSGYTISGSATGTIAIGSQAKTISPTATVSSQWYTTGYTGSAVWNDMSTTPSSNANLLTSGGFSGLNKYPKVRVSGTIKMVATSTYGAGSGRGSMTFSNVELAVGSSFTSIGSLKYTYYTTSSTSKTSFLRVNIKNSGTNLYASDQLTCYLTASVLYSQYVGQVTVQITKVEVYTQYSGDAIFTIDTTDYGFYLTSKVSGQYGFTGNIDWSSYPFSSTSYIIQGNITANNSLYIDSETATGGSGDDSLGSMSLSVALFNSSGEPISSPYQYEM